MEEKVTRHSVLRRYYRKYLQDGETPQFVAAVARRYMPSTLERLAIAGDLHTSRAAALALGLIGDERSYPILGTLLKHSDRKLRLVADDSIRAISGREGTMQQRQVLELVVRSNECSAYDKTIDTATELIEKVGGTAEVYHQRSLAFFQLGKIEQAMVDCHIVIQLNQYHYGAMVGLGHCYLESGELVDALFWFKEALDIFPDLEPVRIQVRRLEKAIQDL